MSDDSAPNEGASHEQIIAKLREGEALLANGKSIPEACKQLQVSEQTYYRWKRQYGMMNKDQAKQLKELEKENEQLKKLVANLSLDKAMIEEVLKGKF